MPAAAAAGGSTIVVGGDALALRTAQELCALQGRRIVVLWRQNPDFARMVEAVGAVFVAAQPDTAEGVERAGVRQAGSIIALSPDDQLNLHAALLARDANPQIRIVLRQFNRTLAGKIEQNLTNCSVLSLAWHSAATYAAVAIDPSCFRGLQFPEPAGPLTGFALRTAENCELADVTVEEAEQKLAARILAIDGETGFARDTVLAAPAELIVYGDIARLENSSPRPPVDWTDPVFVRRLRAFWRGHRGNRRRVDPIVLRLIAAAFLIFLIGTWHFHDVFGEGWLDAAYFVITTMTTTGYGDLSPNRQHPVDVVMAMLLMLSGITLTGLFIAFGSSLLTRVQWVTMQGLRVVHRRGHIIVCGAGSIGAGVIQLLLALGKHLVVIESAPDATIVEQARARHFDLLTGDASRDETLALCNLDAAHGLVALTNVDTLNLEIALGARARNPTMPIVLRIADASLAESISRHFEIETTYSAAALAAPAFAGLSRFAGSRGRVAFAGREFEIGEFQVGRRFRRTAPRDAILIAVSRGGGFAVGHDFGELVSGGRALILVPPAPLREGVDALAAAAGPFLLDD